MQVRGYHLSSGSVQKVSFASDPLLSGLNLMGASVFMDRSDTTTTKMVLMSASTDPINSPAEMMAGFKLGMNLFPTPIVAPEEAFVLSNDGDCVICFYLS